MKMYLFTSSSGNFTTTNGIDQQQNMESRSHRLTLVKGKNLGIDSVMTKAT